MYLKKIIDLFEFFAREFGVVEKHEVLNLRQPELAFRLSIWLVLQPWANSHFFESFLVYKWRGFYQIHILFIFLSLKINLLTLVSSTHLFYLKLSIHLKLIYHIPTVILQKLF